MTLALILLSAQGCCCMWNRVSVCTGSCRPGEAVVTCQMWQLAVVCSYQQLSAWMGSRHIENEAHLLKSEGMYSSL